MVNVGAGGGENGLTAQGKPGDSEGGIQKGDGHGDEGRGHAEEGGGFLAPDDPEATQEEADGQTAAIAHEDGGWTGGGGKECEKGAEKRSGYESQGDVAGEEGAEEGGGGGKQAHAGGEAIEAIDEVEGIDAADQPEDGEGDLPPGACRRIPADAVDPDVSVADQGGGEDLRSEEHTSEL